MAAPYNPPVKGENFKIAIFLSDAGDALSFKIDPTIAAGDVKVSKDFGTLTNITTLPTAAPAGTAQVSLELSATEMNADVVTVFFEDQTDPKQWCDFAFSIPTTNG